MLSEALLEEHLPRWIAASLLDHFNTKITGVTVFNEETERTTFDSSDWVEVRFDGPHTTKLGPTFFKVEVDVNLLISTSKDETDIYAHSRNIGKAKKAFSQCIPIFRYGDGAEDTQDQIGILSLRQDLDRRLRVNRWGEVDKDLRLIQGSVDGTYQMELTL